MSNVISQKPKFARGGGGGCGGDGGETDPKRSASLYHERHPVSARNSAQINGNRFPRIGTPGWRRPAGPPGLSPPLRGFPYPQAIFFLSFTPYVFICSLPPPTRAPFFLGLSRNLAIWGSNSLCSISCGDWRQARLTDPCFLVSSEEADPPTGRRDAGEVAGEPLLL